MLGRCTPAVVDVCPSQNVCGVVGGVVLYGQGRIRMEPKREDKGMDGAIDGWMDGWIDRDRQR